MEVTYAFYSICLKHLCMFTTKGITVFSESLEMLRHVQYGNTLLI